MRVESDPEARGDATAKRQHSDPIYQPPPGRQKKTPKIPEVSILSRTTDLLDA
jgi:hypothetical protein